MFLKLHCWIQKQRLRQAPDNHLLRGAWGEAVACAHLKHEKGYRLLTRNWRWKHYELDVICWDGPVLVFVEVRTCAYSSKQGGVHSIRAPKKSSLRQGCVAYLQNMPQRAPHYRFDILEVRYRGLRVSSLRHYAGVPLFVR